MKKFALALISLTMFPGCTTNTNEITSYPAICESRDASEKCTKYTPLNKTTYVIDFKNQKVVSYMPEMDNVPANKYNDCAIVNLENWSCKFNDNSGTFGFSNGKFFDIPSFDNFEYISKDEWSKTQ